MPPSQRHGRSVQGLLRPPPPPTCSEGQTFVPSPPGWPPGLPAPAPRSRPLPPLSPHRGTRHCGRQLLRHAGGTAADDADREDGAGLSPSAPWGRGARPHSAGRGEGSGTRRQLEGHHRRVPGLLGHRAPRPAFSVLQLPLPSPGGLQRVGGGGQTPAAAEESKDSWLQGQGPAGAVQRGSWLR